MFVKSQPEPVAQIRFLFVQLLGTVFLVSVAFAQEPTQSPTLPPTPMASPSPTSTSAPTPPSEPVYREYRGVSIGMAVEEARAKLGVARSKGPRQDFYVYSEKETVQIFYRDGKVSAISVDYVGSDSGAPTPMEVLGVEIRPRKNGSLYRMLRYPKSGYWISYNRTAGNNPITTITMRRMR